MLSDGVEQTVRRGTGTCFQFISVFIALHRVARDRAQLIQFLDRSPWRAPRARIRAQAVAWGTIVGIGRGSDS